MYSIDIAGKRFEASLSKIEYPHGVSVLVTVFDGEMKYIESKVTCSSSSEDVHERIAKLSEAELLLEAWEIFKSKYPFDKIEDCLSSGLVVLVNWMTEYDRQLKSARALNADIDKREFIDRLDRAANRAKEFACTLGYVDESISGNHVFTIYLTEDHNREIHSEKIVTILGGRKVRRGDLICMTSVTAGKYLWVDGKVPEWINITIANATDEYAEFELTFNHRLAEANAVKLWPDVGMPEGNDLVPFRVRGPGKPLSSKLGLSET